MIKRTRLPKKYAELYIKELEEIVPILRHHGWDKAPIEAKGRYRYIMIASTGKDPSTSKLREEYPTPSQKKNRPKPIGRSTGQRLSQQKTKKFFAPDGNEVSYDQLKEGLKNKQYKRRVYFRGIKHHK